jgi:hypothetical protein
MLAHPHLRSPKLSFPLGSDSVVEFVQSNGVAYTENDCRAKAHHWTRQHPAPAPAPAIGKQEIVSGLQDFKAWNSGREQKEWRFLQS